MLLVLVEISPVVSAPVAIPLEVDIPVKLILGNEVTVLVVMELDPLVEVNVLVASFVVAVVEVV